MDELRRISPLPNSLVVDNPHDDGLGEIIGDLKLKPHLGGGHDGPVDAQDALQARRHRLQLVLEAPHVAVIDVDNDVVRDAESPEDLIDFDGGIGQDVAGDAEELTLGVQRSFLELVAVGDRSKENSQRSSLACWSREGRVPKWMPHFAFDSRAVVSVTDDGPVFGDYAVGVSVVRVGF